MNERERERKLESRLDRAVEATNSEAVEPEVVERAGERVWGRLFEEFGEGEESAAQVDRAAACVPFRAMIGDQLSGRIDDAQEMLLQDHLSSCAACRKAALAARTGTTGADSGLESSGSGATATDKVVALPSIGRQGGRRQAVRWAVAAAVILTVGLAALGAAGYLPFGATPVLASVSAVDGGLYRLEDGTNVSLAAGEQVRAGEDLRTGRGGTSLLALSDGSTLEMSERSVVSLKKSPGGLRVDLDRGNVIVHAAEQRDGRLVVATDDAQAAVKGTIFSVKHGVKGTRVSVLEGEVEVDGSVDAQTLGPGEQIVTRPGLESVNLGDEFSWSRDADEYVELAAELSRLEREVSELVMPGERHGSRLLGLVPLETALYVAMPNVGQALVESHALLDERMAESDVLRAWWEGTLGSTGAEDEMVEAIERVGALSEHLGDEIVVAMWLGSSESLETPLVLAETTNPSALRTEIELLAQETAATGDDASPIRMVGDDEQVASGEQDSLYLWIGEDVVAASPDLEVVVAARSLADEGDARQPADSEFLGRVAAAYEQGVDWLIAVDLEHAVVHALAEAEAVGGDAEASLGVEQLGIDGAETLIVTREMRGDRDETEAELLFSGPRTGMAAWLAEPGPMGSLSFVAPDAYAAAAFVVDDPALALDDIFSFALESEPDLMAEVEADGHDAYLAVIEDVAAALGGEVAVAVDGPLLPEPNVKLIAEVDDPAALQLAFEAVVSILNDELTSDESASVTINEETVRGSTLYRLTSADFDPELCYAVHDGYLVAARSCGHVDRAMEYSRSGVNLGTSEAFQEMLPGGGHLGFSALAYQQLGDTLGGLAGFAAGSGGLSSDQAKAFEQVATSLSGSMAYAYAEDDRVRLAHTAEGGLPWLSLFAILGEGPGQGLGHGFEESFGSGGVMDLGHGVDDALGEGGR